MKGSTSQPKVFVSYSWSSPRHEQWVLDLAERLSADGILVVLDKWDLKEGQDKHIFMEQMVGDEKINKVLVICDRVYQAKANDRTGGVGTETQLISKEVYENTKQEKFIPIVCEYDENREACIPHYMTSRIYIDLSSDEKFEIEYQKLIRNLYGKPSLKRPSIGTPPSYVTSDEQTSLPTSHKVSEIRSALMSDRKSAAGFDSVHDLDRLKRFRTRRRGVRKYKIVLFKPQFPKYHSYRENLIPQAVQEMVKARIRPAALEVGLAFAAKYPNAQRHDDIIIAGARDNRDVATLCGDRRKRTISPWMQGNGGERTAMFLGTRR